MKNKDREQEARLEAFFIIFSTQASGRNPLEVLEDHLRMVKSVPLKNSIRERVVKWNNHAEYIDKIIQERLRKGSLGDLSQVSLATLRLGLCEMELIDGIPPEVAINEALEIAKLYGDESQARFVNAILDSWLKSSGERGDESASDKSANVEAGFSPSEDDTSTIDEKRDE